MAREREEPLYYIPFPPGELDQTTAVPGESIIDFMVPPVEKTAKHNQFMRDMERMQWFAKGTGYTQNPDKWSGRYEQEEYNCVLRYLNKYGWAPAKTCIECGTVIEDQGKASNEPDNR